ncbi:MAG: zinc-binding dehydrogenase [Nitrospirae bacterium]|nr:zinc-binding dehydrogenase [Nitrospirota bacterium]
MKAVLLNRHGGLDALEMGTLPEPRAEAGEAVVRVKACGLNHLDVWVRKGLPNLKLDYPHVLGSDIAGIVDDIKGSPPPFPQGSKDGEWKGQVSPPPGIAAGTRVVLFPGLTCGYCPPCISGQDDMCREFKLFGEHVSGGYTEKIKVPVRNLVAIPDTLSFVQAACIPVAYLTAWHMVVNRARVQPDEWVLVTAAASGVSTGAIQIAKIFGAQVIAAASSKEKLAKARELGADVLVDYSKPEWSREVKKITNRRGVDVILDHVGQSKWEDYIPILAKGGRLVICGASSGHEGKTDLRHVFFRRLSILGSTMGSSTEFRQLVDYVGRGRIKPVIYKTLPLEQAREAHRILEEREVIGKVVLEI